MRSVVFICLISIATARPNGNGYSYVTQPNLNYIPSAPSIAAPQQTHYHHQHQQFVAQQPQPFSFGYNSNNNGGYNSAYNTGGYNNVYNSVPTTFNNYNQQQTGQSVTQHHQQQQKQILPTIVSKHFYIHSAPEEADEEIFDHNSIFQRRKHYNVVFIKAPTQTVRKTATLLANALNEQKTVIYVLSKKNDVSEIRQALQEVVPHEPSRPEVFFIKYKTPEEANYAQNTIQAQYDALGGTTKVSDEGYAPVSSVIGTFGGINGNGNGISSYTGNSYSNGIISGSGNLIVGGSAGYLPPNQIKK